MIRARAVWRGTGAVWRGTGKDDGIVGWSRLGADPPPQSCSVGGASSLPENSLAVKRSECFTVVENSLRTPPN